MTDRDEILAEAWDALRAVLPDGWQVGRPVDSDYNVYPHRTSTRIVAKTSGSCTFPEGYASSVVFVVRLEVRFEGAWRKVDVDKRSFGEEYVVWPDRHGQSDQRLATPASVGASGRAGGPRSTTRAASTPK